MVALMLTALPAVEIVVSPGLGERALACGLTLGTFGVIAAWTRRNRTSLDGQDWCECAGATVTMRVIPSARPESIRRERARASTPAEELEEIAR